MAAVLVRKAIALRFSIASWTAARWRAGSPASSYTTRSTGWPLSPSFWLMYFAQRRTPCRGRARVAPAGPEWVPTLAITAGDLSVGAADGPGSGFGSPGLL